MKSEVRTIRNNETIRCKVTSENKSREYSYIFTVTKSDNKIIIGHSDEEITVTLTDNQYGNTIPIGGQSTIGGAVMYGIILVIERDLKNNIEEFAVMTVEGVKAIEFE